MFNMFKSESNPNLLFKDSTKCLQEVPPGKNYTEFLGKAYMTTIDSLRECSGSRTGTSSRKTFEQSTDGTTWRLINCIIMTHTVSVILLSLLFSFTELEKACTIHSCQKKI